MAVLENYTAKQLHQRDELTHLLAQAARLEQSLMCQYLFAIYSMKRFHHEGGVNYSQLEKMRRWQASLLPIARQEMEHLGLVLNLCTAIGQTPGFVLPNFPYTEQIEGRHLRHSLDPFGIEALTRFAEFEMPQDLPAGSEHAHFLKSKIPDFDSNRFDAIAVLYDKIYNIIESLPDELLFVGSPSAQLNTHDIFPGAVTGLDISRHPAYGVLLKKITNRSTALAAITQITSEGEGAQKHGGENSHFATIMQVLAELTEELRVDHAFAPARPVASNPSVDGFGSDDTGNSIVTHAFTAEVLTLFESSYTTLLLALTRFFSFPDNDSDEMSALQQIAFYPMMTTIIRPLCEILTVLPVDGSASMTAGASFRATDSAPLSAHKWSAFHVLDRRYSEMELTAQSVVKNIENAGLDGELTETLKERLQFIYEQIGRSRILLRNGYHDSAAAAETTGTTPASSGQHSPQGHPHSQKGQEQ